MIPLPWYVKPLAILFCFPSILAGCVKAPPLPLCERYTVQMAMSAAGPVFVLDRQNLEKLAAMVQGLSNGTCRLDKPKPDTKSV